MAAFGELRGTCAYRQWSEAFDLQVVRAGLLSTRTIIADVLFYQPVRLVRNWEVWF